MYIEKCKGCAATSGGTLRKDDLMNETLQAIAKRYSCRAFRDDLPTRADLTAIAQAAVQSPSGMNRQPWEIVVITDKKLIEDMDAAGMRVLSQDSDPTAYNRFMERGGTLYYNAPCMFLILQQSGTAMDTGIVSENIALAATALGLGNVICGLARLAFDGPQGAAFKESIGFPAGYEFGVAVLVGFALNEGTPHPPDEGKIRFLEDAPAG